MNQSHQKMSKRRARTNKKGDNQAGLVKEGYGTVMLCKRGGMGEPRLEKGEGRVNTPQ